MWYRIISSLFLIAFALLSGTSHSWAQTSTILPPELLQQQNNVSIPEIDTAIQKAGKLPYQYQDSAIRLLQRLFIECQRQQYTYGMANALLMAGNIYVIQEGDPELALFYYRKAIPYCRMTPVARERLQVRWNVCMGAAYTRRETFDSAMIHFYKALNIMLKENWKEKEDLARMYNNMGIILYQQGQYDKALLYTHKAYHIALESNLKTELLRSYGNYAGIYTSGKNQYDSAIYYTNLAINLDIPIGERFTKLFHEIKGMFYLEKGQPEKAIPFFLKALKVNDKLTAHYLNRVGLAYFQLKEYKQAEYYYLKALRTPDILLIGSSRLQSYTSLVQLYDSLKNYKQAYFYKTLASTISDSINNAEQNRVVNQLETSYRTAEKDKEITKKTLLLTASENRLNKKDFWLGGIIAGTLLIITLSGFAFQRQRLKLQKAQSREQQQKIEQLNAVIAGEEKERSRIGRQLHDDVMVEFSIVKMNLAALPSVYPVIKSITAYKEVEQQLELASIKLRQTAHNLMPDALLEEGLVSALHYFCNGVQKTTGIRICFHHYGATQQLPMDMEVNLYRIVQELIQNVIKHSAATKVLVQISYRNENLHLMVEDDGVGIGGKQKSSLGMGLKSIRTRLQAIDGRMEIHACKPQGTSVNIELIVNKKTGNEQH